MTSELEDAATSEISRAAWQWLGDGRLTPAQARQATKNETATLGAGYEHARALFDAVPTGEEFVEFLTPPASDLLT